MERYKEECYDRRFWDGWAEKDALYAICADPSKKGCWDHAEFFRAGETEVQKIMTYVTPFLSHYGSVLDFGCGVGRLTRAFKDYFQNSFGIDISPKMIEMAQQFSSEKSGICFQPLDPNDLWERKDHYDFIYSSLVFQHLSPNLTREYLQLLLSQLAPKGLFVFQLTDKYLPANNPTTIEAVEKLMQNKVFNFFREGIEGQGLILTGRVRMYGFGENLVRQVLSLAGGEVIDVRFTNHTAPDFDGKLEFLSSEKPGTWVSKLYVVKRKLIYPTP